MGQIVVGVDGSPASRRALEWAENEARLRGSTLVLVSAWEVPATTMIAVAEAPPVEFNVSQQAQEHAVESILEPDTPSDLEVRRVSVQGHPAPTLLAEAEGAELLVLGGSGHGEFAGMLLGSVALHAVTHAPCPVVIVRGGE